MMTPGSCRISRPTMNFCKIAAGKAAGIGRRAGGAHVEVAQITRSAYLPSRRLGDQAVTHQDRGGERRSGRRSSAKAQAGHRAVTHCALRARKVAPRARRGRRAHALATGVAVHGESDWADGSPTKRLSPVRTDISSVWPLPAIPAMPRISPPETCEFRCLARSTPNWASEADRERRDDERSRASPALGPDARRADLLADHQLGQAARRLHLGVALGDLAPAAQDGRPLAKRADSPRPACGRCRGWRSPRRTAGAGSRTCARPPAVSAPMSARRGSGAWGCCNRQRTISMRWRSPTERS